MILDIVFQMGKFISSGPNENLFFKILPAITSGVISAFIAYCMFKLGQNTQNKKDRDKEKRRLDDLRELLYINLLRLKLAIYKQIKIFENSSIDLGDDHLNKISTYRDLTLNIDIIPKDLTIIPKSDVYKIVLSNDEKKESRNNIKIYSDFNSGINLLEFHYDMFIKTKTELNTFYNDYLNKILKERKKIDNLFPTFLSNKASDAGIIMVTDTFHIAILELIKESNAKGVVSIDGYIINFILPLEKITIANNQHKDYILLAKYITNIKAEYNELLNLKLSNKVMCEDFNGVLKNIIISIETLLTSEFKNMKYGEEIFSPMLARPTLS